MTTPATRTPVRIARGTYSDLNASVADILDGEICWATDQDKIYVKDGGSLVATMLTSADVGVTVQGYDADTAKTDVAQTFTAAQTFNAAVVFNENQSNVDLRCEGQNASHLAFLDASTNRIGINQGAPAATFDINGNYVSNIVAIGSGTNIDCSLGNYFTINIAANTTLTVSNVPAGRLYSFVLSINHTGGTITWFTTNWPNATAPVLQTPKYHQFVFYTDDGGTVWRTSYLTNFAS